MKGPLLNCFILIIISKIILSQRVCKEEENFCSKCNPVTKLCVKCEKDIYTPNEFGGCSNIKKCEKDRHHCLECDGEGKLCKKCDASYYPDENGGCSYTKNCEVSYKGNCIKCKEDFILIGKTNQYSFDGKINICKSLNSEDLKNCKTIDTELGVCTNCKEGYHFSFGDKKCTLIWNCYESIFGVCQKCASGYYLDKRKKECIEQKGTFKFCKVSLDSKTCGECDEGFYFDEGGMCVDSNFCKEIGDFARCKKCINGYYLTTLEDACTPEPNCLHGDKALGICKSCNNFYYIDRKDGTCKSNREDNDFKYCEEVDGECVSCISDLKLTKDGKCSYSKHCTDSNLGTCYACEDTYHLGLDNLCTNIEHCLYSDKLEDCLECEDNYYYDLMGKKCKIAEGAFENCLRGQEEYNCNQCRNNYYLNKKDFLCHSNTLPGPFYKCMYSDSEGEKCIQCIKDYYLGYIDNKCSAIYGCEESEDENTCLKCSEVFCLNLKDNKCYPNDEIISEEEKFYYRCNVTNFEGTKCEKCVEGYELNEDGLCIDEDHCIEKVDNVCKKCEGIGENFCLNNVFGCVQSYIDHCLECNQILDLTNCTKCEEGYEINEFSQCELKF